MLKRSLPRPKMVRRLVSVGFKFTRLKVISLSRKSSRSRSIWKCVCNCGAIKYIRADHLMEGRVKSCGCYSREMLLDHHTIHGQSKSLEYGVWLAMRRRCHDKNNPAFKWYGGRGLKVCKRWYKSFLLFIKDIGHRPSRLHSLERIDNDKGYVRGNVEWVLRHRQAFNKRNSIKATFNGITKHIKEWCLEKNLNYGTIRSRIQRSGLSPEAAIEVGAFSERTVAVNGQTKTLKEWAKVTGVSYSNICFRIKSGWAPEDAVSLKQMRPHEYSKKMVIK